MWLGPLGGTCGNPRPARLTIARTLADVTVPAADPVGPLRPRIQQVLDGFLARQRAMFADISGDLLPLADAAADLLRGGKRLRPAFFYWGWRAAGGTGDDGAVITAASALELFQAAALVHDDVIDDSDTRRGEPAVHRKFAADHNRHGWHGPADSFGTAAAILLGDILLGWSDELLMQAGLDHGAQARARPIFERMRTEVGAGQYLDVLAQVDTGLDADAQARRARDVILHKSARYSVQHPLVLGAHVAGAHPGVVDAFITYGSALGEAFQLRDDVLGVFGDPEVTGKPAGDDLREGKRTLLIAYALERADSDQAATIATLLGDGGLDAAGVQRIREILIMTGARERVEARIATLVDTATASIDQAEITDSGRDALRGLITQATTRAR